MHQLTITVGLSGYGVSGVIFHAPLIEKVQGLALTAIMSSDPAKVHRDYPHGTVVSSLDGLLADKHIMLVVIATPNDTHYEAHYDRYRPFVGDRWREHSMAGGGMLYDLGPHLIDQALFLFGVPKSVWTDLQAQRPGAETDDYSHLVLEYPQLRVILHAGSLVREQGPHFQIHGSKGSFIKYGLDAQEDALRAGRRPGDPGWGEDSESAYGELTADVGGLTLKGKVKTLPSHYEAYYQGIIAALTQGKPPPVTAEDTRNTIQVIECALQSSRERRAILIQARTESPV